MSIFFAGNSVNANNAATGDRARVDVLSVVVLSSETATPTALPPTETFTPEPPTATEKPIPTDTPTTEPTATRRDTPTATATRTHTPAPSPTPTVTPTATPTGPSPGDGNCDGRISAADLSSLLSQLDTGEAGECAFVDADCNAVVDEQDVFAVLSRIFGGVIPPSCL